MQAGVPVVGKQRTGPPSVYSATQKCCPLQPSEPWALSGRVLHWYPELLTLYKTEIDEYWRMAHHQKTTFS
jgi:hypothetical protein